MGAHERALAIQQLPRDVLIALPQVSEEVRLVENGKEFVEIVWHDMVEDGHRVVVTWHDRVVGRMFADGFVMLASGVLRPLTRDELWDFI